MSEYIRPSKKAKLDAVQSEMSSLVQSLEEELRQKDEALKEAMKLMCQGHLFLSDWKQLPTAMQNDSTVLTQVIANQSGSCVLFHPKRHEVNETVIQDALPGLLSNYRGEALNACKKGLLKWEEVNPTREEWRTSASLSVQALRRGLAQNAADVPVLTRDAIVRALQKRLLLWDHIPEDLRNDQDFCRLILCPAKPRALELEIFEGIGLGSWAIQIFRLHPTLVQESSIWEHLIEGFEWFQSPLEEIFAEGFHPSDASLMEQACAKVKSLLKHIDQITFSVLVQKFINENPKLLFNVNRSFIEAFPDFVIDRLAHVPVADSRSVNSAYALGERIPRSMWDNEDFFRTWFKVGLPCVEGEQTEAWKSDPDKLLLLVEHCATYTWKCDVFNRLPDEVEGDANFWAKVMQFEPLLFEFAAKTLRNGNYELAVRALGDDHFFFRCMWDLRLRQRGPFIIDEPKMTEFLARGRAECMLHEAFVNPFLCAVTYQSNQLLGKLNQPMLLETIAEFVGIPRGKHLFNVRKLVSNRAAWNESKDTVWNSCCAVPLNSQ